MGEPINFCIPQPQHPPLNIKIQEPEELESEAHSTGLVMWPAAVILSRYITNNPSLILDHGDIIELGAGCGLVGFVAAAMLRQDIKDKKQDKEPANVFITDYDTQTRENLKLNARLNDFEKHTEVLGLDFFDQSEETFDSKLWTDMEGGKHPQVNLILGADIIAYSNDAGNVANTIQAALTEGGLAIIVTANEDRRFGVKYFEEACYSRGLEVEVTTKAPSEFSGSTSASNESSDASKARDLLDHDLGQTSGYGEDYDFTMFTVNKPKAK